MALSAKNMGLSPAASDLGLGDMLKQQLEDTLEERRKKGLQQGNNQAMLKAALSPATQSLQTQGMLPASQLLFLPPGGA